MTEWILTSSVLILLVLLVRALAKGSISLRLQYALWALVLVRLLVPINFSSSSMSLLTLADQIEAATMQESVSAPEILPQETVPQAPSVPLETSPAPAVPGIHITRPTVEQQWEYPFTLEQTLGGLWVLGMAILVLVMAASNLHFGLRLKRSRIRADIAGKLPVYYSGAVDSPCLFGLFRPSIYLPTSCQDDPEALSHVLAHEQAHYRHLDHIWSVLRCVCLCVHWYNPLVWICAVKSKADGETACDEAAIRLLGEDQRIGYGKTLISLSRGKPGLGTVINTATTMDGSQHTLRQRIALIVHNPKTTWITLLCVILAVALILGFTFIGPDGSADSVGRLVYYNGNLYAVQQAPAKLYGLMELPDEESLDPVSIALPDSVGTIVKCDKSKLPNRQLTSNYFPEGTTVYADPNYDRWISVEAPWTDDGTRFTLTKVTKAQIKEQPVLTMQALNALIETYGDQLSFQHLERYRSYEKSSDFYQLFFEIGDSDHSLSVSDHDADGVLDSATLYSFQSGHSIDPRYTDIDDFLSSTTAQVPEPPEYNDGGIEGCFVYAEHTLYAWDYTAEAPIPRDGVAQESFTVEANDNSQIPYQPHTACRLDAGTVVYKDSVYDRLYTKPGPIGSDLEYGVFVPVLEMDPWWQESTVLPGYYAYYENAQLTQSNRSPYYLYFDEKGNGAYMSEGLEIAMRVSPQSLRISRNYSLDYRVDGHVVSTSFGTYVYIGTEKPELPVSSPLTAGTYIIGSELGVNENYYFQKNNQMILNQDGTGSLTWENKTYFINWSSDGLYADSKLVPYYFNATKNRGCLIMQINSDTVILTLYRSVYISQLGDIDTSIEAMTKYRDLFAPTDEGLDYSRALSCVHNRFDVDLSRLFYNGITGNPGPNQEELEYLVSQGFDPIYGIGRITAVQLEETLQEYFGITMDECKLVGLGQFVYYNGSYFFNHTADEKITIEVLGVLNASTDCPIVLYRYTGNCMPQYQGMVIEVMLERQEDGSMIVLHNSTTDYALNGYI